MVMAGGSGMNSAKEPIIAQRTIEGKSAGKREVTESCSPNFTPFPAALLYRVRIKSATISKSVKNIFPYFFMVKSMYGA